MNIQIRTYRHWEDIPPLPGNYVFYSTALFRALERTSKHAPTLIVAYKDGIPVGKLMCITRRYLGITFLLKKTYVYGSGEYFNLSAVTDRQSVHEITQAKETIFSEMLSYFTKRFGRRSFLLKFRNLEEPLFGYRFFRRNGYFPVRWLRVNNSIHQPNIDKWMSASRKRQISQGYRNGAVTGVAQTRQEVEEFFALIKKNYPAKIRHYLPNLNFFLSFLDQSDEGSESIGKVFVVRYKDRIIGGSVCLFSDKTCYLIFSTGMRKTYLRQYPGVLCIWEAMKYAHEQQFEHFEFIDAGLPFRRYGFRDFILRFGGKQISTRRWVKIRIGWLNKLLTRIYV